MGLPLPFERHGIVKPMRPGPVACLRLKYTDELAVLKLYSSRAGRADRA